ncbi:mechanosensitive ion channel family protein [Rehaibacterium terrae]|uniref:Small-conductance mechanosensitive channel n=1 Tax=Rehaibacterium terrae TaxID=1341696 RepID=A0A7W7XYV8_9GAMM|nr:mechanosensitive ion channel domain-containing protein [Rehaibacterium terrae]MBB5014960.1 small-conductance mechanosensitive channel [Rehaibacterium terrae]
MKTLTQATLAVNWIDLLLVWGLRLFGALLIVLLGLWLARRMSKTVGRLLGRTSVDPILRSFFANLAYAAILILVIVTALDAVGVPPTSLLAVVGAAGLAIGLAMRDSLSNIAAGVMLIVLRPFRAGDVVKLAGTDGVVEQVRLFQTVIRTFDNHEVILPNAQIAAVPIINFTAREQRRIDIPVGIGYDDDVREARRVLLAIAAGHGKVLTEPAADVVVTGLGDNSVNLALRAWVRTPDFAPTRSDLLEAVHRGLGEAGITIPYPQRDVHLHLPDAIGQAIGRVSQQAE